MSDKKTDERHRRLKEAEDDGEPIGEMIDRLKQELLLSFEESDRLQEAIRESLGRLDAS